MYLILTLFTLSIIVTNHVHKNFLSIVWLCCQVSSHATDMISSHDLSRSLLLFFGMEIYINTSVFWMFSKIALLQATDEFLIFRAIAELKSFGFSCVVVGKQYSLNFILVSYFHFEMFGIMADIFLLAAICIFSLFPFVFLTVCGLHFQVGSLS